MLDAGRPPDRIAGLTLFHDHSDDRRRYVLAETPALVADPDPRLSLLLFRGEQSGGLLQFESHLAPTAVQLVTIEQTLSQRGRSPILARPDWRAGTVRVAGWLQTEELAPAMLAIGAPSLVGDPRAIIAARLDASGAALADAALRGNALPTVVIFELETLGLAGPLGVEVEADLQALHDRLTAEGALTTPYGRARIAKTWESAARDNVIRVRVVDESGDVQSRRAEAMRQVGEDLIARMFSPFPPSERPAQLDNGTVAPLELSFRLTMRREELETTSRWDYRERRAVAIRHYAAASLIDLLGGRDPSDFIAFADVSDRRRQIVVRTEPELSQLGLAAIEVDLGDSAMGVVENTVVLTDASPEVRLGTTDPDTTLRFRLRTRFDPDLTSAPDRESDWREATGGLVAVSPRRTFPPRRFTVLAGRVEFDWLDHVEVLVSAPGEATKSLVLTADAQIADAFFPAAGSQVLTVTAHWRGVSNEPARSDPPREVEGDLLVLDSPFADSINVLVAPLPRSGVMTTVVELEIRHEDFSCRKTVSWDAPDRTPRRVGLRRLAGSPRRYVYRTHLIHDDGTVEQKPWAESELPALIVGADRAVDVRTVDVVLLGGGPAARGSLAVELVLEGDGDRAIEILEGDRDSATLVVAVAAEAAPPVLIVREFLSTGQVHESRWDDPGALTVLPPVVVTA
jgi:hypothetical protein